MCAQFIGFQVKLTSSQLGTITGTVRKVTNDRIELTNAVLNDKGLPVPSFVVESQFIENLRILATGSSNSSAATDVALTNAGASGDQSTMVKSRNQRREMLRNIPNTCNAYVCPDSPPLINRSSEMETIRNLEQLKLIPGPHLSNSTFPANTNFDGKFRHRNGTPVKRRTFSMSDAMHANEISGTESDSYCTNQRYNSSKMEFKVNRMNGVGKPCAGPRGTSPGFMRSVGCGGSTRVRGKVDWDHFQVENFIHEEFDFERNLAMFDKNAFYEMVDGPGGVKTSLSQSSTPVFTQHFIEGPDGVGTPLIANCKQNKYTPKPSKDYYDDCTMTTNTATMSSIKQRHELSSPYYDPSSTKPKTDQPSPPRGTCVCCHSSTICTTRVSGHPMSSHMWYTSSGSRVPVLTADDQFRILHYLATGQDPENSSIGSSSVQGLSWGRLIESTSRSLVDYMMLQFRNSRSSFKRSANKPPPRVLVISGTPSLSGVYAINLARLLAIRGACVLLLSQPINDSGQFDKTMLSLYDNELDLCRLFAPRPNRYGLEDNASTQPLEASDDNEDEGGSLGCGLNYSDSTNIPSDDESVLTSGITMDQFPDNDALEYSPLNQMWISRMPGMKLLQSCTTVTKLASNVRVDMVFIGHSPQTSLDLSSPTNQRLMRWLQTHHAISHLVHLMPQCVTMVNQYNTVNNKSFNWIVDLGLPKLLPIAPSAPTTTDENAASHATQSSHLLVDAGLSRGLVGRLTSDLKCLPPYGLFDSGSVVTLIPQTSCS